MIFEELALKIVTTTSPVELEAILDSMTTGDRHLLETALERIATKAAQIAAYAGERCGYGCSDQGHTKAVDSFNRASRIVQCKAFGYNAYHNLRF